MRKLKVGDRVGNGSFKGVVQHVDKEYVWLAWNCTNGIDRVLHSSPLLLVLKVQKK